MSALLGLAGSVAAGKSTLAEALAQQYRQAGRTVEVVSTDGFLFANAELERQGLLTRKGFPESYDVSAFAAFLDAVRAGTPARVPLYSHRTYDIVTGAYRELGSPELVILEGINALQPVFTGGKLDLRLYLHAQEDDLFRWYRERLQHLRETARTDPDSYFARFLPLSADDWEERIATIWTQVNLPNLHQHILPSRDHADFVLEKGPDHQLLDPRVLRHISSFFSQSLLYS